MNRVVKFRAYDKEKKVMIYDFDQNTLKVYNLKAGGSIHHIVYNIGLLYDTLMEFTGLYDKNGKEIYEGDILEMKYQADFRSAVEFIDNGFWIKGIDAHNYMPSKENREVIGNTYENSDKESTK